MVVPPRERFLERLGSLSGSFSWEPPLGEASGRGLSGSFLGSLFGSCSGIIFWGPFVARITLWALLLYHIISAHVYTCWIALDSRRRSIILSARTSGGGVGKSTGAAESLL